MTNRKKFLKEFNEAFARNDLDFILQHLSEDIEWTMVGENPVKGKENFRNAMKPMENIQTLEMKTERIIVSDNTAAVDGIMKIKEPSGEIKSFAFCDLYEFSEGRDFVIKKMTSYVISLAKTGLEKQPS